jgi:DNA-binding transcriptional regulator/RsmH inhibitor MraZ
VILAGGGERFEMWSSKAWEQRNRELASKRSSTLDDLGI